jgi:hypothetical protein
MSFAQVALSLLQQRGESWSLRVMQTAHNWRKKEKKTRESTRARVTAIANLLWLPGTIESRELTRGPCN